MAQSPRKKRPSGPGRSRPKTGRPKSRTGAGAKARTKPPGKPRAARPGAGRTGGSRSLLRVRWNKLRPMFDFWGKEFKRYYSLETLQSSVERTLRGKDLFLKPSFQTVTGPGPISSVSIELFQEGRYQHIFRVVSTNTKKKRGTFGLVVAKNHEEHSAVAKKEHANLLRLHERNPKQVVEPLRGGTVYLPDRHRRTSHGREVYAYVTRWLNGYHELGIDRDLRMFINDVPRERFSVKDSEDIKCQIIEVILRSFEPKTGEAMELPQIASGDFVATRPGKGRVRIKLIACRRLRRRLTPARLLRDIVEASWPWGRATFHLMPEDPALLRNALVNALGKEEGGRWLNEYRKNVESGRFAEQHALPLDALRQL